jgi:acyl carrier protein
VTADTHDTITAAVRSALGEVVGNPDESILAAGVDSRVALQCHAAVEKRLKLKLPATLVFDYPTVSAIVGYVSTRMLGGSDTPPLPQHLAAGEGPGAAVCQVGSVRSKLPVAGASISDSDSSHRPLGPVPDALSTVPFSRWDADVPPAFDSGSKPPARFGGFVTDVELFDAQLFACASSEATLMDPQQRLLLELSVSLLAAARVSSPNGSVYVGNFFQEYAARTALEQHATLRGSSFGATGIASSVMSGRLSFTYGLNGPSLTVQTACSSSLVAAHLGRQCLAQRTSAFALVAGVNMLLDPLATAMFSSAAMLAADGRCKTLDARADGYVRAEAVGLLTMSRVAEAAFVVDRPACFVAGSAVNQDGRSTSLTGKPAHSPSSPSVL